MRDIEKRRAKSIKGRLTVKITRDTRDQLMTWVEDLVRDFNKKESTGLTNIILPCLTKVGQNCFFPDKTDFDSWLSSLNKNALYKSLLEAHIAVKL